MSAMSKSHVVEALEELECGMRKIVATEALSLFIHLRRALGMPDVLLDTNFSIYARSASLRSPRVTPQPLRFMEAHSLQSVTPPLSSADASPAGSIDRQRAEMESLIMAARSSVGPGNSYVSNRHRRRKPVGEQQNDSAADTSAQNSPLSTSRRSPEYFSAFVDQGFAPPQSPTPTLSDHASVEVEPAPRESTPKPINLISRLTRLENVLHRRAKQLQKPQQ
jgi:hypothetical protein